MRIAIPILILIAVSHVAFARQLATKPAAPTLEHRLKQLPAETPAGPFVLLDDGAILAVKDDSALISRDGGKIWERHAIFPAGAFKARPEYAITRTRDGAIVVVFIDDLVKQWKWDNEKNTSAVAEPILFVWSTRSIDGGRTWSPPVKVQDGYCGAVRDMIETRDGTLVVPLQKYLPQHSRHATTPIYSTDGGQSWNRAGVLDIGGRGHHDGSIESTVVELRDGELWMVLRTCDDVLAQSFSTDSGKTWSEMSPTNIDASSSPAIVKRLSSGRLAMAWNRLYPEGKTEYPRRAGQHSAKAASWHREELSLAFSDDDGKTWTKPTVVARTPGARVSYPFIFEPRPGVIWLTTMQGGLLAQLEEQAFARARVEPRDVPADGIISESGTYMFAQDLLVERDLGIQIKADNVTLDLNGHALRNTAPPQAKSRGIISSGQRNIRIINGTIGGFWFNVHCATTTDLVVKDVKFDDIPYIGVNVARGENVEISGCSFSNFRYDIEKPAKSTYLIGVNVSANDARVTRNRFDARPPTGTGTKLALETVGALFRPGDKCVAADNEITASELLNRGYGIWVAGKTSVGVNSNRIHNFQYGVTVAADGSAEISRNRISIDPTTNRDPEIETIGLSAASPKKVVELDNEFSGVKTEKNITPATRPG